MRFVIAVVGMLLTCMHCSGPARAETAVTGALICRVQHAIRHRSPAWEQTMCEDVATAANATPWPKTVVSMMVLESDMRPDAIVEAKPGVFDVGLLAVRCVVVAGVCQNGPASGYTIKELKDPATNIRVAAQIIADKRERFGRDWAWRYNGAKRDNGYGRKVRVIEAALHGGKRATDNRRVRKLGKQIRKSATEGDRQS